MIHIVTSENRPLYFRALTEMHLQRRILFIDKMGWRLSAPTGLEMDAFDTKDAIYLIEAPERQGPVAASLRLLPTTRPHLMSEIFADLCEAGVPRGERIWEVSRFCPAPETPKGEERRKLLARMIAGIIETGLAFGIEQVTFVASAALAPIALNVGWDARELGPVKRCGRDRVRAIVAEITEEGLRRVLDRNGLESPVTRLMRAPVQQAA